MGDSSKKRLIKEFIISELSEKKEIIDDKDDLLMGGIIDSLGIMKLVAYLEETFSLKIKDEDLISENFISIENIHSFVDLKTTSI